MSAKVICFHRSNLSKIFFQAVVTEFLICHADLIFCDHLPPEIERRQSAETATPFALSSPRRCRPKSLAISTPTKLITLEEARNKHLTNRLNATDGYIEVGGGPSNLPKKYHTVIELPRKRGAKRSPSSGWRSFFSRSRNGSQCSLKNRKSNAPIVAEKKEKAAETIKLRTVKSVESLTEPSDSLPPLNCAGKPPGHNRSVSHDSYFDTLQDPSRNSSVLDLSEIQLNFELEESEMRIFSEDESLMCSPRRNLTRTRPSDDGVGSPKKQARVVLSPESMSRKRTRLEDQLSDIQYIDCNTPESCYATVSTTTTTALVHTDGYQPKNKSPRNSSSEEEDHRQSLNLESQTKTSIPKSLTDTKLLTLATPQSPIYRPLVADPSPITPYENVLTTISITYVSPPTSIYEDVAKTAEETQDASLPAQEAAQPEDLTLSEVVGEESSEEEEEEVTSLQSLTLSPNVSEGSINEKRKSFESESVEEDVDVYQQVKYFRRSVSEINAMLELDGKREEENEVVENGHVYENVNVEVDSLEEEEKSRVRDLTSLFEEAKRPSETEETMVEEPKEPAKRVITYDRDSLPPCLRARNLKQQTKTRSLDEEDFKKECGRINAVERRKSMDDNKLVVSEPKTLNKPKEVPSDEDGKLESLHLSHAEPVVNVNEQLRRERIEKYKEARRKFLQDKYRSESFKEDKDVLLSRLKVFRKNCEEKDVARTRREEQEEKEDPVLRERKGKQEEVAERRRHTFDSREREVGTEATRRISLENK